MQKLKLDIKVRPKLKTYGTKTQCVLKLEILELGKLKLRTHSSKICIVLFFCLSSKTFLYQS